MRAVAAAAERNALRQRLRHRDVGAELLAGHGLEIGALHYPLALPAGCTVEHLDVADAATMRGLFPELADEELVEPRWVGDVVLDTVPALTGRRFDFIVANHVLEHVANPIQAIANLWAGLVDGGHLVVSVPDKQFTFDRARSLTSFEHVLAEFYGGVTAVDAQHYVDLLEATTPEAFASRDSLHAALARAVARREHVHVWDTASFRVFWARTVALLGLAARVRFESPASVNRFEYFAVIQRAAGAGDEIEALRVLATVYAGRSDLQRAFPRTLPDLSRQLLTWATTAGASVDSDAACLHPYQPHYRRLLDGRWTAGGDVESRLRVALADLV